MSGHRSHKRHALGQHFLRDSQVIDLIVDTIWTEAQDSGCVECLEIGPGRGALTEPILKKIIPEEGAPSAIMHFSLVEMDRELGADWKERLAAHESLIHVEIADFCQVETKTWLRQGPLAVVSNLPYSSSTAILNRLDRKSVV